MDKNITVGHPFYFPTQIVLVDDDPDFLEGVSLMLDRNLSYKLFQSASQALEYLNTAHRRVQIMQRCYTSYKTGPLLSDTLAHVDISKLHLEVLNGSRFQTCSSVIVDYSMPEMSGLEFLVALKNPFVKKVLLTGQADMELAVRAFNRQLIDQFIDKHDPRLKTKLNATIKAFQEQYFRTSFKLVTDSIIASNHDGFLVNTGFHKFFDELKGKLDCVEYYLLDEPHSGFLMVDYTGGRRCLLVYTEQGLADHYQLLMEMGAPKELLAKVRTGELLPCFDDQDEELEEQKAADPRIKNWKEYYFPGMKVNSKPPFYVTITSDEQLPKIHGKDIVPYSDFLQANCPVNETMH